MHWLYLFLAGLFEKLPDDRYRIYLVTEDGSEQLITDVNVREKKAVELDKAESNGSGPAVDSPLPVEDATDVANPPDVPADSDELPVPDAATIHGEAEFVVAGSDVLRKGEMLAVAAAASRFRAARKEPPSLDRTSRLLRKSRGGQTSSQ